MAGTAVSLPQVHAFPIAAAALIVFFGLAVRGHGPRKGLVHRRGQE